MDLFLQPGWEEGGRKGGCFLSLEAYIVRRAVSLLPPPPPPFPTNFHPLRPPPLLLSLGDGRKEEEKEEEEGVNGRRKIWREGGRLSRRWFVCSEDARENVPTDISRSYIKHCFIRIFCMPAKKYSREE